MSTRGSLEEFLQDIEPFFYGKSLTYVDVGAYVGKVFRKVAQSGLKIREAHLVEPNPTSLKALRENVEDRQSSSCALSIHHLALAAEPGVVSLRAAESMSQVVASDAGGARDANNLFEVECKTLDQLSVGFTERHISLLKIDVEGFEDRVLAGARGLLAEQRIDVIYVEAGMNPTGTQQCYYRVIDDILLAHGYRVFKMYEQVHEWISDSPLLRRVNLAYMSERFASQHPYRLCRDLYDSHRRIAALEAELSAEKGRLDEVLRASEGHIAVLTAERDQASQLARSMSERGDELELQLKERSAEAQFQARLAEREAAELARRVEDLSQRHQEDQQELARSVAREESLAIARDDLRATIQALDAQRLVLVEHLSSANEELERRELALAEEQARARSAEQGRAELERKLELECERQQQLERGLALEAAQVGELRARTEQLMTELVGARRDVALSSAEQERLASLLGIAEGELQRARAELGNLARNAAVGTPTSDRERDELRRELTQVRHRHDETERMAREVHRLYVDLRNRERKARADALTALDKAARTRQHLSYRLGAALIASSRTPLGWLKAPAALKKAYDDFARERGQPPPAQTSERETVRLGSRGVVWPLSAEWQRLNVVADLGDLEVVAHVFSVTSVAVASVELVLEAVSGSPSPEVIGGEPLAAYPQDGLPRGVGLKLRAGRSRTLLRLARGPAVVGVKLRKVRGEPCIVRIEARSPGEAPIPAGVVAEAPLETATRVEEAAGLSGVRLAALVVQKHVKKPSTNVLLKAFNRIQQGEREAALDFARQHADDDERQGIHLLRTLLVGSDDQAWLDGFNRYLEPFGIAPLELSETSGSRYQRLRAKTVRYVEAGPLVSVIMPAFNAAATLEFAAGSILSQTWRPLELIIVDDDSKDATWEIAQRLAKSDARVRILRNVANVGPYVSKNLGLRLARGEYVTGHDADDWAHPERIEAHLVAMTASRGNIRASLAGMLRMTSDGRLTRFAPRGPNTQDGALVAGFISALFEARFLKHVLGGWDTVRFAGDSELIQRAERATGGPLPRFAHLGMICLDSPDGLTNHPEFGYSPALGVSACRMAYRDAFKAWHETLAPGEAYLPFPHAPRRFAVPKEMALDEYALASVLEGHTQRPGSERQPLRGTDVCDVCVVTDLRLPGGNASSTIEEIRQLQARGLSVIVVHCPSVRTHGKPISSRYDEFREICHDFCDVTAIEAKTLIVRHPAVASSSRFKELLVPRIKAKACAVIVNNSFRRSDGEAVYSPDALLANVSQLRSETTRIFPLGPAIRRELSALGANITSSLADHDWTPTFDASRFAFKPKETLAPPFALGRHARDGAEKWPEDRGKLLAAYPEHPEFSIRILGGADAAVSILGHVPGNWQVLPFGSLEPPDYLAALDVFVYFPHTGLNEAFGRAVMEAIFAGVPCVLPRSFRTTFEDMAFYSEPEDVAGLVRRLARYPEWRLDFLRHARDRARRYDAEVLWQRLAKLHGDGAELVARGDDRGGGLSGTVKEYKAWVETGHWNSVPNVTFGSGH